MWHERFLCSQTQRVKCESPKTAPNELVMMSLVEGGRIQRTTTQHVRDEMDYGRTPQHSRGLGIV